jgi:hypothetical protein
MREYIEVDPKDIKVGESYYFIPTWGYNGYQTEEQKECRFMENAKNARPSKVLGVHKDKYTDRYDIWHSYEGLDSISGRSYESTSVSFISPASTTRPYVKNRNYNYFCKRFCHWCGQRIAVDLVN